MLSWLVLLEKGTIPPRVVKAQNKQPRKVDKKKLPKIITDLGYTAPELIEKAMLVLEDVEAVSWEPFLAFFKTYTGLAFRISGFWDSTGIFGKG